MAVRPPGDSREVLDTSLSPQGALVRLHLRVGWWSLFVFLTLGFGLEMLHAFKVGLYLNVSNEPRRLMWTLAHAHGTLLALVHLAFAATVSWNSAWNPGSRRAASACLLTSCLLVPLGFLLGGLSIRDGDPGLGVALVPPGALLLMVGVFLTARGAAAVPAHSAKSPSPARPEV